MKWTTTKASEIQLGDDVRVELERVDNSVKTVLFTVAGQPQLRICLDCYAINVAQPSPPKMVERFKLTFKLGGTEHTSLHETKDYAEDAANQLDPGVTRTIEEVKIEEPDK